MKRLMDALESVKKENDKLFLGNNIAEIISEICGISETFQHKNTCSSFIHSSTFTALDLRYDIGRMQINNGLFCYESLCTLCKWCKKLGFFYKQRNKKRKFINNLMLTLCLQSASLLKTRLDVSVLL